MSREKENTAARDSSLAIEMVLVGEREDISLSRLFCLQILSAIPGETKSVKRIWKVIVSFLLVTRKSCMPYSVERTWKGVL